MDFERSNKMQHIGGTLGVIASMIRKPVPFEGDYEKSKNLVKFALLGNLEPHNLSIEFKDNRAISLPFGIVKNPKSILLYVDNVNDFITKTSSNALTLQTDSLN